jgi:hypothetical protein
MGCFRSARTIFLFDHLERSEGVFTENEISAATKLFQLSSSFATQGFRVESAEINERESRFVSRDLSRETNFKSIAHYSQFLATIWPFYQTESCCN